MAQHFKADGTVVEVAPKKGKSFGLKELQEFVGGYIEIIQLPATKQVMVVNEEGKLHPLPLNERASELAVSSGIGDVILGDALVCKKSEVN